MRRLFVVLALLVAALPASAASATDTWMTVLLEGRKIGHLHETRTVEGDRVTTTQTLDIALDRAGTSVAMRNEETSVETREGQPLAFRSRTELSGVASTVEGKRLPDGRFEVRTEVGGQARTRTLDWPDGALLAEGQRLAALRAGSARGAHYTVPAFDPSAVQIVTLSGVVQGAVDVDLPEGRRTLTEVRQSLQLGGGATQATVWTDAAGDAQKMTLPIGGLRLDALACSRACALAPNQSADILTATLAAAPRALSANERAGALRYTLATADGSALDLPTTDEQRVQKANGALTLRIGPARAGTESPPTPADTAANDWLQADAPALRELAEHATLGAADAATRMRRLEAFVHGYVRSKDLSVGYASALEVMQTREGDCTEHAVLLAALARALGIPARVLDGLVYVPQFGAQAHVFVPHAWVQAWVDGRWQSYDGALGGFDAGHIALGVGDGDPWRFYAGLGALGKLRIERVEAVQ